MNHGVCRSSLSEPHAFRLMRGTKKSQKFNKKMQQYDWRVPLVLVRIIAASHYLANFSPERFGWALTVSGSAELIIEEHLMKKKLIALAVASLLSAPTAFAQSSVTLYGSIDYGYTSLGSNDAKTHTHDLDPNVYGKVKSRTGLDSGISKANRIGFKGTEDLGNGLKAIFVLENGLVGDTTGNGIFSGANRQSYAGLSGGFGTVAFGRQYSPQHVFTSAVDPFGKNGFGSAGNVLMQDRRADNIATYASPNWGGFGFLAGYSLNAAGNEHLENDTDIRLWALAATYTWDKLFVAGNYHATNQKHAHTSNQSAFNAYDLYASYDFGFVKVGSTVGRRTTKKDFIGTQKDAKLTQWMIGATFRLTPNDSILTSYSRAGESKIADGQDKRPRIGQWALGYEHSLSKRTVLYSQFAMQSHNRAYKDHGFASFYTDGPVGSVTSTNGPDVGAAASYDPVTDTWTGSSQYRRGFAVGFRHDF
jgi:predicted porin